MYGDGRGYKKNVNMVEFELDLWSAIVEAKGIVMVE